MGITRDIVTRATKDEDFRQRLITDPRAAIKKDFGVDLPANVAIQVHENSPSVINLVLPGVPEAQRSLSPQELEQVSGGMMPAKVRFATLPCTSTHC